MERIYYAGIGSPIGTIWASASEVGLFRIDIHRPEDVFLDSIRKKTRAEIVHAEGRFDALRGMLADYFMGRRVSFDLLLDLRGTDFQRDVWRSIQRIPYGKLSSYRRLAEEVGRPRAVRATGNAVGDNPLSIVIPCHRVVRSDGGLGGYGGGLDVKRYLLSLEGVFPKVKGNELVALEASYPRNREDLLRYFFE